MAAKFYAYDPLKEREVSEGCRRSNRSRRLPAGREIFTESEISNVITDKGVKKRVQRKTKRPKAINADISKVENNNDQAQRSLSPIYEPPAAAVNTPNCNGLNSITKNPENSPAVLQRFIANNCIHWNSDYAFENDRSGYLRLEPFTQKDAVVLENRINITILSGVINVIADVIDIEATTTEGIWISLSKDAVYKIRNDSNECAIIHFCKEF